MMLVDEKSSERKVSSCYASTVTETNNSENTLTQKYVTTYKFVFTDLFSQLCRYCSHIFCVIVFTLLFVSVTVPTLLELSLVS